MARRAQELQGLERLIWHFAILICVEKEKVETLKSSQILILFVDEL